MSSSLIIESLNTSHNRSSFRCGNAALDDYIQKQANQDIKRRISQVFIARNNDNESFIQGYYSLSSLSIKLSDIPEVISRKLPRHSIPAALIGRLAVHSSVQNQSIGKMLLVDAIKRTLALSSEIGIFAMVVDAINDDAISFYSQFGFMPLVKNSSRLFLPLKSITDL